ncbi:MAG: DNA-binding response regulator [Paenibacillus sp.]|nr:DNA-binding response regulator [Paenibacillus sp.]
MQSNSDNELTAGGSTDPAADPMDGFEEGAYCETTRRVVIISPYPASVRSLVMALTIRCYDVLVFHHENDPILTTIQSDLVIVDRTKSTADESMKPIAFAKNALMLIGASADEAAAAGNDSLVWPCPIPSALAKVEELASRNDPYPTPDNAGQWLRHKDVVMDLKRITVHKAGMKIELTRTEFDLFKMMLANGGGVLTRQDMMRQLWGDSYFGGSNSVDVHVKSLRHKLGDDPKVPQYIATVRGIGYRIAD